jgi:hypothetical protein
MGLSALMTAVCLIVFTPSAGVAAGTKPTSISETFESGTVPVGWRSIDRSDGQAGWQFNDPSHRGNLTGGTGGFAIIDSEWVHSGAAPGGTGTVHSNLDTPMLNLSRSIDPTLTFRASYLQDNDISQAAVLISADYGQTWTTVWATAGSSIAETQVSAPLASAIASGPRHVRIRFTYKAFNAGYLELDDVTVH